VVGAAAATGRLLRLDVLRMTHALGIAATSACGLGEMLGGMSKSYNIARAGREGLASALLAAGGFTSSLRALEAPRGFAAVLADGLDIDALTGDLGTRWEAAKDTYKPFPCGIVLHPLIDGCLQLAQEPGFDPAQIESVEVRVHPLVLVLTGRTAPKDGLEAKLSYTHACAVALVDRAAGVDQFDDARANDPVIVRARHLVRAAVDTALGADQAEVTIRFIDGRSRSCRIEHAIGSLDNPMTDAALASKFRALGARSLGEARTRSLLDRCLQIDTLADAGELIALARPAR
jgi:2-methylcitrate dehydratase PrpD